jgi:preprotein translocase subunit SecA
MAGRGTDIVLGEGVTDFGGLHIIGTERHESRRIDNQLRGRSGRQGDPGSSRFYLALEDDLLRIFGGERITTIMERFGMEDGEPIEHGIISRAIENAQSKVEAQNFDMRKHILEYDDVMNQQREVIYGQRREILRDKNLRPYLEEIIYDKAEEIALDFADEKLLSEEWDFRELKKTVFNRFFFRISFNDDDKEGLDAEKLTEIIYNEAIRVYNEREELIGEEYLRTFERRVMLYTIDNFWKDHLMSMDHLKEGIGLRGYAQQNPLLVYKKEGFDMFSDMVERVKEETLRILFSAKIENREELVKLNQPKEQNLVFSGSDSAGEVKKRPVKRENKKVGRNDPCSCGSGKKYKKCCGK